MFKTLFRHTGGESARRKSSPLSLQGEVVRLGGRGHAAFFWCCAAVCLAVPLQRRPLRHLDRRPPLRHNVGHHVPRVPSSSDIPGSSLSSVVRLGETGELSRGQSLGGKLQQRLPTHVLPLLTSDLQWNNTILTSLSSKQNSVSRRATDT